MPTLYDVAHRRLSVVGPAVCVWTDSLKPKVDRGISEAGSANEAEEIRNSCHHDCRFKSGSARDGIQRCISTIAVSTDSESTGVGNTFGHEVIHAIQKVLNGQSTPVGTHIMKLYSSPYYSSRVWKEDHISMGCEKLCPVAPTCQPTSRPCTVPSVRLHYGGVAVALLKSRRCN